MLSFCLSILILSLGLSYYKLSPVLFMPSSCYVVLLSHYVKVVVSRSEYLSKHTLLFFPLALTFGLLPFLSTIYSEL